MVTETPPTSGETLGLNHEEDEGNHPAPPPATNLATKATSFSTPMQQPIAPPPPEPPRRSFPFQRLRRRRATSAPPSSKRRRRRMIEDHFRVDYVTPDGAVVGGNAYADSNTSHTGMSTAAAVHKQPRLVVLPGLPKYEEDWARDLHDFFNLVMLLPVVYCNLINWDFEKLVTILRQQFLWTTTTTTAVVLRRKQQSHYQEHLLTAADAWNGEWFDLFLGVTIFYFVIDLLWVCIVPHCVKSPATILQHHVATLLYLLIPYLHENLRWCMGACMIVEINTWLLIARRVFNKQGFPPWVILDLSFVSLRVKLISILFYFTWIVIRCILYPMLLPAFYRIWMQHSAAVGTSWNLILLSLPLHAAFCLLNLKWSYDLLMSKVRYWRRKYLRSRGGGGYSTASAAGSDQEVSKGL